jgi:hypothetical protein
LKLQLTIETLQTIGEKLTDAKDFVAVKLGLQEPTKTEVLFE